MIAMTIKVMQNVQGKDIPPKWLGNIGEELNRTFTIIICPEKIELAPPEDASVENSDKNYFFNCQSYEIKIYFIRYIFL